MGDREAFFVVSTTRGERQFRSDKVALRLWPNRTFRHVNRYTQHRWIYIIKVGLFLYK